MQIVLINALLLSYDLISKVTLKNTRMNIGIDLGQGTVVPAKLEMKKTPNSVILHCTTLESGEEIVSDDLHLFTSVEVDENNPQRVTLHSNDVNRTYVLQNITEVSNFFQFLQQNVRVDLQSGSSRVFLLSKKAQQGVSQQIYEKGMTGIDIVKRVLAQVNQKATAIGGYAVEESVTIEVDGIKNGIVDQDLGNDFKAKKIDEIPEDLSSIKYSEANFMKKGNMEILTKLFSGGEREGSLSDYEKLCNQWKTIGKGQWEHSFCLRKFVVQLESAIKNSQCAAEPFDEIIFNVMMSLFSFYFQRIEYDCTYIHFLELFIKEFIANIDFENNTFSNALGETKKRNEIESQIFWCFKDFFTKFIYEKSGKFLLKKDLLGCVCKILEKISPSTAVMIKKYEIKSLVFVKDHSKFLFTLGRNNSDSELLIMAITASKDPWLFYQCLVAGVLVVLQARLQESESKEEFGSIFDSLVPDIETRLIIHNAENIYAKMTEQQE